MSAKDTRTQVVDARRVVAPDGTEIAYWTTGEGPPLVAVHGSTADHTRWTPLLPHLEPNATVHAMDRRGRGGSGDAAPYDVTREFEDVAAVIDAVAERAGSPVDVYGHSFGGFVTFKAFALTSNIRRIVLYEGWPPVDASAFAPDPAVVARLDALLEQGEREAVLETFMTEVVEMPEEQLVAMRAQPSWEGRIRAAHTLTREIVSYSRSSLDTGEAAKIDVPVLLVLGADSSAVFGSGIDALVRALPDARTAIIDGQQHLADVLVPEVFARHVVPFLREGR